MRKTILVTAVVGATILIGGAAIASTGSTNVPDHLAAATATASPSESTTAASSASTDANAAAAVARAAVPGADVTEVEAVAGGGWKVHLVDAAGVRYEIWVDADGAVVKAERSGADPVSDDPTGHDAGDDRSGHQAGDDPTGHDHGDDRGGNRGHGGDDD
jgi:hypothetical protein